MITEKRDKVIIANCSGFFGDRLSAAKEMVQGGPIDFLTGDYLAELTMAILFRTKMKDREWRLCLDLSEADGTGHG